jgi:ABC-type proline/glycine betaine transport system permease subunit
MGIEIIAILVAVVGFGLFFFVVKRLLRMAVRLALVGAILFALLAGGVAWWWYSSGDSSSSNTTPQTRNSSARPARSPR